MNFKYKVRRLIDKLTRRDKTYTSIISDLAPWVYISYIPDVFYKVDNKGFMRGHQSRQETIEIVKCFNVLGYNVFMTNSTYPKFPRVDVRLVFGIEPMFTEACKRYSKARKIYYATGAYYGHHNQMIQKRTEEFNKQHKVEYPLLRLVDIDERLEIADKILQIGSKYTIETYPEQYRGKITIIHQSCTLDGEMMPVKHGNDYMWIGGGGAVLKGLDLVIDCFVKHPDKRLHVVGLIEKEFLTAYPYEMKNIIFHGFMDVSSDEFRNIASQCAFMVYPSCTEGGLPGSVITAMYYGLIPIVSKWAAFDEIEKYGYMIRNLHEQDINEAINWSSKLCEAEKSEMSNLCMEFSRQTFNLENYKNEFNNYFSQVCRNQEL